MSTPYEEFGRAMAIKMIGIEEEERTRNLIELMAHRHNVDLGRDAFGVGSCQWCRQEQPCDGAIITIILAKELWMLGAVARMRR